MGISVEFMNYPYGQLVSDLVDYLKCDGELLEKILLFYGRKTGDTYTILNNELYEDYNCYYNVMEFIERYYNVKSIYEVFNKYRVWGSSGESIESCEEALNIELPEIKEEF